MDIYLIRHGIAFDIGEKGFRTDEERSLTVKGKRRTRNTALALKKLGCKPAFIYTSPLVRAQQTAEILVEIIAPKLKPIIGTFLKPEEDPEKALKIIEKNLSQPPSFFIGHLPNLSYIASALVGHVSPTTFDFRKSGVCCLECIKKGHHVNGSVKWMMEPDQLEIIAGSK